MTSWRRFHPGCWDETTWSELRRWREEEPRSHPRNLERDLDEVTKMVRENSQDIKTAGNVGGKGSGGGGGLSWSLVFVHVVSGVTPG